MKTRTISAIALVLATSAVLTRGEVNSDWRVEGLQLNESTAQYTSLNVLIRGPKGADASKVKIMFLADWNLDGKRWRKPPPPETPLKMKWTTMPVNFEELEGYRFSFMAPVPAMRAIGIQVTYKEQPVAMFWYPPGKTSPGKERTPSIPKARAVIYNVQTDWRTVPTPGMIVVGNFRFNAARREGDEWTVRLLPEPFRPEAPIVYIKVKGRRPPFEDVPMVKVSPSQGIFMKVLAREPATNTIYCDYVAR